MTNLNLTAQPAPSLALRILMVGCGLGVVSLLYLPLAILPQIALTYHLPPEAAGNVLSAFGFAYAIGFLIFGPLSDRVGTRVVLSCGLVGLIVACLLLMVSVTSGQLLASRALQGFAASAFPPAALAYLGQQGSARQRNWSVAWMSTAFLSAGLFGQIYGYVVAVGQGLANSLIPFVALYALTAGWIAFMPNTGKRPDKQRGEGVSAAFVEIAKSAQLRRIYVPALALLMCFVSFYATLSLKLTPALAEHGIGPIEARLFAAPGFLAPLVAAALQQRWGTERVMALGLMATTAGLLMAALAGPSHIYALLAASFVFVSGIGISIPGLIARTTQVSRVSIRTTAIAAYTFTLFLGASVAPWLTQGAASFSVSEFFAFLALLMGLATVYSVSKPALQREFG